MDKSLMRMFEAFTTASGMGRENVREEPPAIPLLPLLKADPDREIQDKCRHFYFILKEGSSNKDQQNEQITDLVAKAFHQT